MNFNDFIEKLHKRLQVELPGEKAQYEMAPINRKLYSELKSTVSNPRLSAVLILIYPEKDSFNTLLIKRPEYEGVHSGQIAFPGGKYEEDDQTLLNTALREANEEVGIILPQSNVIGCLSEVYIQPSNFLATPYIGFINHKPEWIINENEVAECIETNIIELSSNDIKTEKMIQLSSGFKIKSPCYEVQGHTIWGATAMMISEFNAVLKKL